MSASLHVGAEGPFDKIFVLVLLSLQARRKRVGGTRLPNEALTI